ncbi:hypothetical protein ACXR2U_10790 [Jatrophihabitans sp. YIM 134969]
MTTRDTATDTDTTDEVAPDDAATSEGGTDPAAVEPTTPGASDRSRRHRRRHAADDTDEVADTDTDTDTDTDSRDEPTGAHAASGRAAGRRRRERPTGRRRRWPLMAAVVVAALFAGAMVGLWAATRPDPIAGLTGQQQAAVTAASQAAVNLQTFRRASFDQDFANALASLTPDYGKEQFAPRKAELEKQLVAGKRDATATVQSAGLVSSTASQAVVLVVTNTVQTADDGTSTPFVFSRLQLTLQRIDGKWLVSDLKSVGLS